MQVISDTNAGGRIGSALGTGLQQLAHNKLEQVMKQYEKAQSAQAFAPYYGQGIANLLSNVTPEERKVLLQNPDALLQLSQLVSQQQGNPQAGGGLAALQEQAQPQAPQQLRGADVLGGALNDSSISPFIRQALANTQVQSPNEAMGAQPQAAQQQPAQPQGQPSVDRERARLLGEAFTSPHERREKEKLQLKKSDVARKASKEVRDYLKPGDDKVIAAKKNIRDYDLLIKLAEEGDLRSGRAYQLLSKIGLEDFNVNDATQVAKKLSARLAQNSQTAFGPGARITNYLEKTFQGSLPSLWNTPEGIIKISKLNKLVDEGAELEQNIRRDILKENNWEIPPDVEAQVRERFSPIDQRLTSEAERIALSGSGKRFVDKIPAGYKGRVRDTKTGKIKIFGE
jgi:hypothetical protein